MRIERFKPTEEKEEGYLRVTEVDITEESDALGESYSVHIKAESSTRNLHISTCPETQEEAEAFRKLIGKIVFSVSEKVSYRGNEIHLIWSNIHVEGSQLIRGAYHWVPLFKVLNIAYNRNNNAIVSVLNLHTREKLTFKLYITEKLDRTTFESIIYENAILELRKSSASSTADHYLLINDDNDYLDFKTISKRAPQ